MTDHHVHTYADHGTTALGGQWERCPRGTIRVTENGQVPELHQPPDPNYNNPPKD